MLEILNFQLKGVVPLLKSIAKYLLSRKEILKRSIKLFRKIIREQGCLKMKVLKKSKK